MKKNNKRKKGFTLIELVIVLAVLAIIALIAIPNFTKVRQDSLKKADIESCNQIEKITLMSIANEDITYTGVGFIKIVFNNGVMQAPVYSANRSTPANPIIIKDNYKTYLKDIKAPQYGQATTYIVEIDANGNVTAETDKIDKDGIDKD